MLVIPGQEAIAQVDKRGGPTSFSVGGLHPVLEYRIEMRWSFNHLRRRGVIGMPGI